MTFGERHPFLSAAFPPGSYGCATPVSSEGAHSFVDTHISTPIFNFLDRTLDSLEASLKRVGTALRSSSKRGLGHGDGDRVGEKDMESTHGEKDIGSDMEGEYDEKDMESTYGEKDIGSDIESEYDEKDMY
ncbi:hypothetical protein OQA88_7350 [Cercophora sp. LCS_1]